MKILIILLLSLGVFTANADINVEAVKKQIEEQKAILKNKPRGAFFGKNNPRKRIEMKIKALEKSLQGR